MNQQQFLIKPAECTATFTGGLQAQCQGVFGSDQQAKSGISLHLEKGSGIQVLHGPGRRQKKPYIVYYNIGTDQGVETILLTQAEPGYRYGLGVFHCFHKIAML